MPEVPKNAFEEKREQLIRRNRERLLALGLYHEFGPKPATKPASAPVVKRRSRPESTAVSLRRSKRTKTNQRGGTDEDVANVSSKKEELVSLEDKPRKALNSRSGSSIGPRSWEERISELELSGLISCSKDEGAKFIVIGSTGKNYEIVLTDDKRKCQCLDHRLRRRDCKHIKLVLRQLETADSPENWFEAVNKMISKQATFDDLGS